MIQVVNSSSKNRMDAITRCLSTLCLRLSGMGVGGEGGRLLSGQNVNSICFKVFLLRCNGYFK